MNTETRCELADRSSPTLEPCGGKPYWLRDDAARLTPPSRALPRSGTETDVRTPWIPTTGCCTATWAEAAVGSSARISAVATQHSSRPSPAAWLVGFAVPRVTLRCDDNLSAFSNDRSLPSMLHLHIPLPSAPPMMNDRRTHPHPFGGSTRPGRPALTDRVPPTRSNQPAPPLVPLETPAIRRSSIWSDWRSSISGNSFRAWTPRLSLRSIAARIISWATSNIFCSSQP